MAAFLGLAGMLIGTAGIFFGFYYLGTQQELALKIVTLSTVGAAGFIAFVPLAVYRSLDWPLVPVLLGVAAVYAGGAYGLFRAGLRRYESGNQMGTRL